MRERPNCRCILCQLEKKLLAQIDENTSQENYEARSSTASYLIPFPRSTLLLAQLRAGRGDASSDQILRELAKWQDTFRDERAQNLFVLAFLPLLHAVMRSATTRYPGVAQEDAAQQALLVLLQFLASAEFRRRESHLAFAVARKVKRRTLEWARREKESVERVAIPDGVPTLALAEHTFEREVLLHHFLRLAHKRGTIGTADLELLIQVKLDGEPGDTFCEDLGLSPNAFRQRLKRLLAKLRRIAQVTPPRDDANFN